MGNVKRKKNTTYALRNKGEVYNIGSAAISRLKNNQSVSTNTLDTICKILGCDIQDIIRLVPE